MNSADKQCIPCRGTGLHLEFKCPICSGMFFGSYGEMDALKRYCKSDDKCRFQWMEYEDYRYIKPASGKCIICQGTGKETLIEFGKTGDTPL